MRSSLLRTFTAGLISVGLLLAGPVLAAEREEVGLRVVTEYLDDEHLRQQGIFVRWRPDNARRLRWEIAFGTLHEGSVDRLFLSGGPVWRFTPGQSRESARFVIDLGINPTLLAGAKFSRVDLGGFMQFTSFVSAGARFGRDRSSRVALRVQHISNGSLNSTNPGTDQLGLEISHRF
jgi:hypothetical protein